MPRRATFAHPSIADLDRQLAFAPLAAVRRRMEAAERLVDEIDPEVAYPLDFVSFRLTGFRPEGTGSPVTIGGGLLREDLATLVLRASERLELRADERKGGAVPVLELARELGVDERSLRRWRGRGLLFHRVRLSDGRSRVAVFRATLAGFQAREGARVARAGAFTRIDPATRSRIVERLRALVAGGETVNLAAKRVAAEFARSHEAVRLIAARTLGGRGSRARAPRDRALCGRALRAGVPAADVAARLGLPESTVRRRADEWRAARLEGLRLAWIEYPTFARPDADETILAPAAVRKELAPLVPEEATAILALAAAESPAPRGRARNADAAVEAMLAAHHFLVRRASRTIAGLRPTGRRLDRAALDRAETDLRWAARLRRRLVERSLPAALVRLRQGLGRDLATLPADEIRGVLASVVARITDSIATVETARGQSLAAKVQLAIDRLVATHAGRGATGRAAARHPAGSLPMDGLFRTLSPWDELVLGAWRDGARLARLDPGMRRLLALRHGLGDAPPATIVELARAAREPFGRMSGRLAEAERRARRP